MSGKSYRGCLWSFMDVYWNFDLAKYARNPKSLGCTEIYSL